ncbi:MAG: hypothetical protein IPG43_21875 [Proteobacteria bacterium]|nr:hypothetical protein [Pseudomonadota bacterium]
MAGAVLVEGRDHASAVAGARWCWLEVSGRSQRAGCRAQAASSSTHSRQHALPAFIARVSKRGNTFSVSSSKCRMTADCGMGSPWVNSHRYSTSASFNIASS